MQYPTRSHPDMRRNDRGAVDTSVEMLFGSVALVMVVLLVFEAVAYWHARNIFDEAASEGVRVAAAYDGSCAEGVAVARAMITRMAAGWSGSVDVSCTDGPTVIVTVSGSTPGVLAGQVGIAARVSESAPKEW